MGTTPKFGLPYPEGTDPVMAGDDTIKALAERLDAVLRHTQTGTRTINSGGTVSITFGSGFTTAPKVVATPRTAGFIVNAYAISTTSMSLRLTNATGTSATSSEVDWVAIGTAPASLLLEDLQDAIAEAKARDDQESQS